MFCGTREEQTRGRIRREQSGAGQRRHGRGRLRIEEEEEGEKKERGGKDERGRLRTSCLKDGRGKVERSVSGERRTGRGKGSTRRLREIDDTEEGEGSVGVPRGFVRFIENMTAVDTNAHG